MPRSPALTSRRLWSTSPGPRTRPRGPASPAPEQPGTGGLPAAPRRRRLAAVPARRRQIAWVLGTVGIVALGAALSPLRSALELPGALLCLLLGVIAVAAIGGIPPAAGATVTATLTGDFLFTTPYYTLRMNQAAQIVDV